MTAARTLAASLLLFAAAPPAHALFGMGKKLPPVTAAAGAVKGDVAYMAAGTNAWSSLASGTRLNPGDVVKTQGDGEATIAFSDGTKISLKNAATFEVEGLQPKKVSVKMAVGQLEAWVKKLSGRRYQVRSPSAVASIRGTEFRMDVSPSGQTTLDCFGGSIEMTNNFGQSVSVDAGMRTATDAGGNLAPPAPIPPSAPPPAPEPQVAIPAAEPAAAPASTPPPAEPAPTTKPAPTEEPATTETTTTTTEPAPTTSNQQNIETAPPPEVSPSSP